MKNKILLSLAAIAFVFMACNGDEIDGLKKRINTLEKAIGSNEPIKGTLTTMDDDDQAFVKTNTYYFKAANNETSYMVDAGDGTIDVYVERFSDVEWYYGAWFYFNYDPATETISNQSCGMYHQYSERYLNAYFYPGSYTDNTVEVDINSINTTTGKLSVTIHATTSDASENNQFSGNAMALDLSFKGTLQVFEQGAIND